MNKADKILKEINELDNKRNELYLKKQLNTATGIGEYAQEHLLIINQDMGETWHILFDLAEKTKKPEYKRLEDDIYLAMDLIELALKLIKRQEKELDKLGLWTEKDASTKQKKLIELLDKD